MITSATISGVAPAVISAEPSNLPDAEIPQEGLDGGAPDPQQQTQDAPPEFQFVLETGEQFRTADDLVRAKAEATKTIREQKQNLTDLQNEVRFLRNLMGSGQQQPNNQQPPPRETGLSARKSQYIQKLGSKVEAAPEVLEALVDLVVDVANDGSQEALSSINSERAMAGMRSFVDQNPVLKSDFGLQVFNKYGDSVITTPQAHLGLIVSEAIASGIDLASLGIKLPSAQAPTPSSGNGQHLAQRTAAQNGALRNPTTGAPVAAAQQKADGPGVQRAYDEWCRSHPMATDQHKQQMLQRFRKYSTPLQTSGGQRK